LGFRLEGLDHEFMVPEGVVEDGLTIGLNLKKVLFKYYGDGVKVLYIKAKGPAEIKAADIVPDADVEVSTLTRPYLQFLLIAKSIWRFT